MTRLTQFIRLIRRAVIRWQLRALAAQSEAIFIARNSALARLMEITREHEIKARELALYDAAAALGASGGGTMRKSLSRRPLR
ncbi:MAG: hypothetical protein ACREX0_00750 [Noviherbaspirillum sp.]